jgi:hypothetical protein
MALRFKYGGTAGGGISTASIGSQGQLPHGLGTTPDEWWLAQHGLSASYFIAASVPDSANLYVSSASAGALVTVFCAVNHAICK